MASLCASWSWAPPVTVAAASLSTRPARVTVRALPCGRQTTSAAPLLRIKLERRPRGALFSGQCQKGTNHHLQPEPEPELERQEDIFFRDMEKERDAYISKLGVHVPPEMFRKQKDEIFEHMRKIHCSKRDILNGNTISNAVCEKAVSALNIASKVMDMTSLGLGTTEISQHTTHQMVRMYARTFCKAAEDAYHKTVQKDTILLFLGALRCIGAIAHILVVDTMAKLEDGPLKNMITNQLDTDYLQFSMKMYILKEDFMMAKQTDAHKMVDQILLHGVVHADSYVSKLIKDALPRDEGK